MDNKEKTNPTETNICKNCGKALERDDKFCGRCGTATDLETSTLDEPKETNSSETDIESTNNDEPNCEQENAKDNQSTPDFSNLIIPKDSNSKKKSKAIIFSIIGVIIIVALIAALSNTCFHSYSEATCIDAEICTKCSKTRGEPLGHDWLDATCTTAKNCQRCAETDGEALGHNVTKWNTITTSTCTEEGSQEGICDTCNETITEPLPLANHTKGKWKITKKATATDAGEKTLKCTECDEIIEQKEYELSKNEKKELYKKQCKSYTYNEIARNPDKYNGKYAKFTGEIIQVQQEELYGIIIYILRVDVTWNGSYYEDTVYVTYTASEDDPRLLEDDVITMYGKLNGEKTYTTVLGSSITIPSFTAEYIE